MLADLRSKLGFRIVGYVLIPQGGISTTASQGVRVLRQVAPFIIEGTTPFPLLRRGGEPACSAGPAVVGPPILMAEGSSSGAGSCRAGVALTFRSAGRVPAKNDDLKVGVTLAWPRRQNHGAVEKPLLAGQRCKPWAKPTEMARKKRLGAGGAERFDPFRVEKLGWDAIRGRRAQNPAPLSVS